MKFIGNTLLHKFTLDSIVEMNNNFINKCITSIFHC